MQPHYDVWFTEDAAAFLDRAGNHLAQDPMTGTVVTTIAARQAAHGAPPEAPFCWYAVVRGPDGETAGVAMRTMPFSPYAVYVLAMSDDAAQALATGILERGEDLAGVNGLRPAADLVAAAIAGARGQEVGISMHMRQFELGELVEPPAVVGRLRAVRDQEAELALSWIRQFMLDADEQGGREPGSVHDPSQFTIADVRRKLEEQVLWFWVDGDDRPVHLTGANPPAYGVTRIGPVFTPKPERGKGWASRAVAEVSRLLRGAGNRVTLYTDQANPTSNAIYQALGYEPVVDTVELVLGGPEPSR